MIKLSESKVAMLSMLPEPRLIIKDDVTGAVIELSYQEVEALEDAIEAFAPNLMS